MEVHVFLHKNGGFPQIFRNAYPAFIGNLVVIYENVTGEAGEIAEYNQADVFRVDVLMEDK